MKNNTNSNHNIRGLLPDINPISDQADSIKNTHLLQKSLSGIESHHLAIVKEKSVTNIDKNVWNSLFADHGINDWDGLKLQEEVFQNNPKPEHNWAFYYYIVVGSDRKPIIATVFTQCLVKDDFVSPKTVSEIIEQERKFSPYFMTTNSLMMGTPLSSGSHLYINRKYSFWKQALSLLLDEVEQVREDANIEQLMLRDFDICDFEIRNTLHKQGYLKLEMPTISTQCNVHWKNTQEYLNSIALHSRYKVINEVIQYEKYFDIEYLAGNISDSEIDLFYNQYVQFFNGNRTVNTFGLPKKFIKQVMLNPNWEIIALRLRDKHDNSIDGKVVAMALCYKTPNSYVPCCIGIDSNYQFTHYNYAQIVYRCILRAGELNKKKLQFGYTTNNEMSMFETRAIPHVMYIQTANVFKHADVLSHTSSSSLHDF